MTDRQAAYVHSPGRIAVKGPGHCAECSPELGVHCGYHCGFFLHEVDRVEREQNVTQSQAEDVVMRRLRMEAEARRAVT